MTQRLEIYKCELCGNMVEMLNSAGGTLSCCGQAMKKLDEKMADFTTEKHVPIVQAIPEGTRVVVGSTPHPMKDEHFVEWIEIVNGPYVQRKYLKPGEKPEADFYVKYHDGLVGREYCNLHGVWKSK
jgi:superoxide reductase